MSATINRLDCEKCGATLTIATQNNFDKLPVLHFNMQGIKTNGARITAANASDGVFTSCVWIQCGGGTLTLADGREKSAIAGLPRKSNCSFNAETAASLLLPSAIATAKKT